MAFSGFNLTKHQTHTWVYVIAVLVWRPGLPHPREDLFAESAVLIGPSMEPMLWFVWFATWLQCGALTGAQGSVQAALDAAVGEVLLVLHFHAKSTAPAAVNLWWQNMGDQMGFQRPGLHGKRNIYRGGEGGKKGEKTKSGRRSHDPSYQLNSLVTWIASIPSSQEPGVVGVKTAFASIYLTNTKCVLKSYTFPVNEWLINNYL